MQLPLLNNLKHPLPVIVGIAAAVIGMAGVGALAVNQFKPTNKIDLNRYTATAKSEDLTDRITASGSIIPFQTANLSPKTSGRVSQLFVEQGDRVQQGDKIAQMENSEVRAAYAQAQANLQQTQANLNKAKNGTRPEEIAQAQARLDQAQANLNKAKNGSRVQYHNIQPFASASPYFHFSLLLTPGIMGIDLTFFPFSFFIHTAAIFFSSQCRH